MIILFLYTKYSYFGKAIYATAQNKIGAQLVGINIDRVYAVTYAISVGLGGIGGILLGTIFTFYPSAGILWMNTIMAITVFGGLGNMLGVFLGATIVGVITLFVMSLVNPMFVNIIVYTLLIITFLVRPQGLLGRVER
jgi:branched-chain amino acid transport system permease protein